MGKRQRTPQGAYAAAAALGDRNGGIPKPPKKWWDEHVGMLREQHPEYEEARISAAVGRIWFKIYDDRKREMVATAEALKDS